MNFAFESSLYATKLLNCLLICAANRSKFRFSLSNFKANCK